LRHEKLSVRTTVVIGFVAILIALALVPATWHCSGAVEGWNFVIYALIAVGGSIVGSAGGRLAKRRVVGVVVTVLTVGLALFAVTGLAAIGCD
jgi:hypothetical protein